MVSMVFRTTTKTFCNAQWGPRNVCWSMQGNLGAPAEQVGRAGQGVHTGAGGHKAAVGGGHKHCVGRAHATEQPQQFWILVLAGVAQQPQHRTHLVYVQRRSPQCPPQSLCIISCTQQPCHCPDLTDSKNFKIPSLLAKED